MPVALGLPVLYLGDLNLLNFYCCITCILIIIFLTRGQIITIIIISNNDILLLLLLFSLYIVNVFVKCIRRNSSTDGFCFPRIHYKAIVILLTLNLCIFFFSLRRCCSTCRFFSRCCAMRNDLVWSCV